MPFYEYRCKRGHTFEALQRMSDDPLTSCNTCDAEVQRVLHPVAVHFKGSGFYTTDYGRRKGGGDSTSTDGAGKDGAGKDSAKGEGGTGKRAKSDSSGAKSDSGAKSKKAASASSE
jgi:putative FmdB family regulatory protein